MTPKEKTESPSFPPHGPAKTASFVPGSPRRGGNRARLNSWPPAALFFQPGCELHHPAAHRLTATNPTAAAAHYTGFTH